MSSGIAKYEDDATPYECTIYCDKLKFYLRFAIYKTFYWPKFRNLQNIYWSKYNNFKANASKYHFILFYQFAILNIDGLIIKSSNLQKSLGLKIDSNLRNKLTAFVENLVKNSMNTEYSNNHHKIRNIFCSKCL